jgi:hypothetical protein
MVRFSGVEVNLWVYLLGSFQVITRIIAEQKSSVSEAGPVAIIMVNVISDGGEFEVLVFI